MYEKTWARRCDDTVYKKRVNSGVQIPSLQGVEQPKNLPQNPEIFVSDNLLMSRFQNLAAKAETALRAVLIDELIQIRLNFIYG